MRNRIDNDIRSLVRLMLIEDATPLVGQHLWPNGRFQQETPGPDEPDTAREAELRRKIANYIGGHVPGVGKITKQDADDLLAIARDTRHKKTLNLYKGTAYRGIGVSKAWFERNFGKAVEEFIAAEGGKKISSNLILKPVTSSPKVMGSNEPVSSWSKDIRQAIDFATSQMESYGLVLVADARANNFLDLKNVYNIMDGGEEAIGVSLRSYEKEVLAIGPVKTSEIYFAYSPWYFEHDSGVKGTRLPKYEKLGTKDSSGVITVKRADADHVFDQSGHSDLAEK